MNKAIEMFVEAAGEKQEPFCDFPGSECGYCDCPRSSCLHCEFAMEANYMGWQMSMAIKRYPRLNESVTFAVEPLPDPLKEESSNNGNYRHYMQFLRTADGYWVRDFYSYHGDIEPFPDYEEVSGTDYRRIFLAAKEADVAVFEFEVSFFY